MIYRSFVNGAEFSFANVDTLDEAIDLLIHTPSILENLEVNYASNSAVSYVGSNVYEVRGPLPSDGFSELLLEPFFT